jgi:abscisic-aldehyde oxidase
LNKGKQTFTPLDDNYPVGQPVPKMVAELQASGEATYVDDIPSPENCLHGAFVYSQEAFAKVQHIDLKAALESAGIVTYVSALDVPPGGKNVSAATIFHQEPLFATDVVEYVGHLLGVVVCTLASKVLIVYADWKLVLYKVGLLHCCSLLVN